jgi:hypothetical protein
MDLANLLPYSSNIELMPTTPEQEGNYLELFMLQ